MSNPTTPRSPPLRRSAPGAPEEGGGEVVDRPVLPSRSAGFPYWAVSPASWPELLDGAVALRLEAVRLDIPWGLHEQAPGIFDWGETRPELALQRVLALARARGLLVWVKPGPWLGPPLPHGGVPARILGAKEVRAVDSAGREARVPSPASSRLAREVRIWLREVADRVLPHAYPHGPVVGWLVGETGPHPTPWGGGGLDYSSEARAFLTRYVAVKYGERGVSLGYSSALPGRGSLVAELDRAEAGEVARRIAVGWALEAGAREGTAMPLVAEVEDHPFGSGGEPSATRSLCDAVSLALPATGDLDYRGLRLIGLRAGALPSETGVSQIRACLPDDPRQPPLDASTATAVLAMSGVRALDLHSLFTVSAQHPSEALLDSRGEATGAGVRLRELLRLLDAIDDPGLRRRCDCLLVANREITRLREARSVSGSLPSGLAPTRTTELLRVIPGPAEGSDRAELDHDVVFDAVFDGLRLAGIKLGVADTSITGGLLEATRVIWLLSFSRMSRSLAQRLFEWTSRGRTLVLGPRVPAWEWTGSPLGLRLPTPVLKQLRSVRLRGLVLEDVEVFSTGEPVIEVEAGPIAVSAPLGDGRLVRFGFRFPFDAVSRNPDAVAWVMTRLGEAAGLTPRYRASDPAVETELHESPVRSFLFVANPTSSDRPVTLQLGPREGLREVRGQAQHLRAGQLLTVPAGSVFLRELVQL